MQGKVEICGVNTAKLQVLTNEETVALLKRTKEGDMEARERLIREEIPLEPHDMPIPWVLTERGLYEDGTPARLG